MKAAAGFYWIKAVDAVLVLIVLGAIFYVYGYNPSTELKIGFGIAAGAFAIVYGTVRLWPRLAGTKVKESALSRLALLDEEGEIVREWDLQGKTSLLIGKGGGVSGEVDIDLSDAEYASLISKQHAVMNLVEGVWYIEDIQSRNGVGMKKARQESKRKLEVEVPQQLDIGDVIFIANTRILVL
ncbi:FHA domain-containing protein [Paenibacillus turpanensis]|uniref:FHA domain-containing protein n=1 Tax=Paenibacillus turpanensis TaxID=2689078 RepID=UPI001FB7920C|nr:FHA domain-containing protein [Paenibacillus turpanensis]